MAENEKAPSGASCENCKFSIPREDGREGFICRRMPPQNLLTDVMRNGAGGVTGISWQATWPSVDAKNWCGEHQARQPTLN